MRKSCYLYVGQIWSWWFPDFKKIGRTSFCLILGNPQPGCRIKTICSLFTNPKSLLPSSRHICTRYIARPAQNPFASTPTIYDPTSRIRQAESFFFLFSVKLKVPPAISETKMTQFKRTFRCSNNCISGFLDSLGFLANLRDSDKSLLKFLKLRSEAHTEVFRHFSSPLKMSSQSYG